MRNSSKIETGGWSSAVALVQDYLRKPTKADAMMARLPENLSSQNRRLCQFLFLGVIRHKTLIDHLISQLVSHDPEPHLKAYLYIATLEILLSEPSRAPKIVDFTIENAKKTNIKPQKIAFLNAILRKIPQSTQSIQTLPTHTQHSHPQWLVNRWNKTFGKEKTLQLLQWNQDTPSTYFTPINNFDPSHFGQKTPFSNFYKLKEGHYQDLKSAIDSGHIYVQDPSTTLGVNSINWEGVSQVLDLCAAPGGKSTRIAQQLTSGTLVAVDLPGPRFSQLEENLQKITHIHTHPLQADILKLTPNLLTSKNLPTHYQVVYLDVPCSNTGVLQRRPDAKWRLNKDDFIKLPTLQLQLLTKASEFLQPSGQLVYSTCSIDPEENIHVIEQFLNSNPNFQLSQNHTLFPPQSLSDGAGVFVLKKL